jgi:hypothetical protein
MSGRVFESLGRLVWALLADHVISDCDDRGGHFDSILPVLQSGPTPGFKKIILRQSSFACLSLTLYLSPIHVYVECLGGAMPIEKSDLLQGTLDIDRASARHSADCG